MNCKIRCSLIATALIISLSGCETTIEHRSENVELVCKVQTNMDSHRYSLLRSFAPELFDARGNFTITNMDPAKLELEINNAYNSNEVEDNRIKITLKSGNYALVHRWFDVYKLGDSYKLRSPSAFSNWAKPYESQADGFNINFNPSPRTITSPSRFSVSGKYQSISLFESAHIAFEGCEGSPEFPVPNPGDYCER